MNGFAKIFTLSVIAVMAMIMASCEADKINRSADIKLSFSCDSLFFDTLFTEQGSATKKIKVYNNCKNKVVISDIMLAQGDQFFVNVDGCKGTSFSNITMNAKDSMIIFVQVNINPNDKKLPFFVQDSLIFHTNGNTQKVYMEACGRNAKRLKSYKIEKDTTITGEIPILVYDTLVVKEGVTLRLTDGAELFFRKFAVLRVDGTLIIEGSQGRDVVLRGERSDYMNTNPPLCYDMASNQWGGVLFTNTSMQNIIRFANIRNTTFGLRLDSMMVASNALTIENSSILNSGGDLISSVAADVYISNSLLAHAGGYIVNFTGGKLEAVHTTIANYYNYSWGGRESADVRLSAVTKSGTQLATDVKIYNTIIYGAYTTELVVDKVEGAPLTCLFKNSLIKIQDKLVDDTFVNCVINGNPSFVFQGWSEQFRAANPHLFDFHLQDNSDALNAADYEISKTIPLDLDGKSRMAKESSDIGCYVGN